MKEETGPGVPRKKTLESGCEGLKFSLCAMIIEVLGLLLTYIFRHIKNVKKCILGFQGVQNSTLNWIICFYVVFIRCQCSSWPYIDEVGLYRQSRNSK